MKPPFLILLVVFLVAGLGYVGYRASASEETRVWWQLESAVESFNGANLSGCLAVFAQDYRDESRADVDRGTLSQALRYAFLRKLHPKTKKFAMRVVMPEEALGVDVEAETAIVRFDLRLEEQRGEAWQLLVDLGVEATMVQIQGDWRIQRSKHEVREGALPGVRSR